MRSAQRQKRLNQKAKSSILWGYIKFLFLPVLLVAFFIFVKLSTNNWNDQDKFSFAFMNRDGNVAITVLDPKLEEMTTIVIPGETEVDVARNYGTLRIKNVWKLSQNEKLGGALLPETVTQNFLFPITLWSDTDAQNLSEANLGGIIKFIILPLKTNMSFGDRLAAGMFSLKVKDVNKTTIDMGKSQYLHKEKLKDGQTGYRVVGGVSERLGIYFSDASIASRNLRVYIVDATGQVGVSSLVGEIVEVLGGKVVSVDKKQEVGDFDCEVFGVDKTINNKIAKLFSCKVVNAKTDFDLEIRLGSKFAKRF